MKTRPIADPQGAAGAAARKTYGTMNGKIGYYELVVNPKNKKIYHFLFKEIKKGKR